MINKKGFINRFETIMIRKLLTVVIFSIFFGISCEKEDVVKPNILFIMSDDHAYQAISAYDDRLIQTPNIDRIADGECCLLMPRLQIQYVHPQEQLY
jgi:hypothetical protein